MRTLYLSDLDGTLLRSDQRLSEYTVSVLNRLAQRGVLFSYATARSFSTAKKSTAGLICSAPVIVHNGAGIVDPETGEPIETQSFTPQEKEEIFSVFRARGLFPIAYAFIEGKNRFSYCKAESSRAQWDFLLTRLGDGREREIFSPEKALAGDVFYFTCIDDEARLRPVYEILKERYRCVFPRDIYSGEQWLEVLPRSAGKACAARRLTKRLGCDRLVCFGDHLNDIPMFEIADECYAVAGAEEELKKIATGVIASNNEDGVAKWLESRIIFEEKS